MPGRTTLPTLFLIGMAAAACGGADTGEAGAPQAEMTAATSGPDCFIRNGTLEEAQQRPSPLRSVDLTIGSGAARLCYGAPSANGREIMGGLVPYGQPWRLGANEPTTLHLTTAADVGGVTVQPGSYSLYAIPGEDEWTFYVNSTWERWGIPIDGGVRASDVGSFTVAPEASDAFVETLTYEWVPAGDGGEVVITWENTRLSFPITAAP